MRGKEKRREDGEQTAQGISYASPIPIMASANMEEVYGGWEQEAIRLLDEEGGFL